MNNKMKIIFFVLLCILFGSTTKIFTELWRGKQSNDNYYFYDERTFGINIYSDPCTKINDNNVFRKYIKNNIKCVGQWCINNDWICSDTKKGVKKSNNCYHVEHIIDISGPEYRDNPDIKNIAANMVMAWGRWNSALGGLAKNNYQISQNEKEIVYGKNIIELVKKKILECARQKNNIKILSNNTKMLKSDLCYDEYSCECDDIDTVCGCDCSAYEKTSVDGFDNTAGHLMIFVGILITINCITIILMNYKQINNKEKQIDNAKKENIFIELQEIK